MSISTLYAGSRNPFLIATGAGEPLGSATVWPAVADWAALSTIDSPRTGDRATVLSLGLGNAFGVAQYSGTQWELDEGVFDTYADLIAFAQPIRAGAFGGVEESADFNENIVPYIYDGVNWTRFAAGTLGFAWALSSLMDFAPTGSFGTLKDGDYGQFGGRLYRYAPAVSIAAGGTTPMWLPPTVYAGTASIRGVLVGTETIPALPGSLGGFSLSVGTGCTITQATDYIQFAVQTSFNTSLIASCGFTTGSTVRTYTQMEIAVTYSGTTGATGRLVGSEGNGQPAWWYRLDATGSIPAPYFTSSALTLQGSQEAIRDGGIAFPSTASGTYSWTEFTDEGRNVSTACMRDGREYARSRRSAASTGPVSPPAGVFFLLTTGAGGAGGTLTVRVKNVRVLTW